MTQNNSANCFTVREGGSMQNGVPIFEGIAVSTQYGPPALACAQWVTLPLQSGLPLHGNNPQRILHARASRESGTVSIGTRPPNWSGVLVVVKAQRLRFEFDPLADDLKIHAGGDGHPSPLIDVGNGSHSRKVQLYELKPGESIFVVDERAAVAVLTCERGGVSVREATADELVDFMVERARRINTVRCVDWARHNAKRLRERPENRTQNLLAGIIRLERQRERL